MGLDVRGRGGRRNVATALLDRHAGCDVVQRQGDAVHRLAAAENLPARAAWGVGGERADAGADGAQAGDKAKGGGGAMHSGERGLKA